MKDIFKKIIIMVSLVVVVFCLMACNKQMVDFTYKFDWGIVYLPNGNSIEGPVESWMDYENSDQIQVKIDGTTYLVHSSNVVLIDE